MPMFETLKPFLLNSHW